MTKRNRHKSLTIPIAIHDFLEAAAARAGANTSDILEATLGAKPLKDYPELQAYADRMSAETVHILDELDQLIRTANPGSQLVFRQEYIGYRRFDKRQPSGAKATRSQMYVSLLPRREFVRMVLPVSPKDYRRITGVQDLSGKGHHGVGDTAIDIRSVPEAHEIVAAFDAWLGPLCGQ